MTKRNRKLKRRNESRDSSGSSRQTGSASSSQSSFPDDRHKMVALVFASLVAGLLLVVNADRVTHVDAKLAVGASRHGWPWVYLERELKEEPLIYIAGETYSWPFPAVKKENRIFQADKLILDLLVLALLTAATYWIVSAVGYRYERWQQRTTTLN